MANRDKRRSFTFEQKLFIVIEQGSTCPKCCKKLQNGTVQFHHKKFWGRGGKTAVDNAEALCANCHSLLHYNERLGRAPRASVAASLASVVHGGDDDDDDDDGDSDNDVMMQDNDEDDEDDELWVPKKAKAKAKATTKKMPKKMPKMTELCEYEQERERNIAFNQARMQQLLGGLPLKAPPPALAAKQHEKQNPSSKKKLPLKMSTTKVTKKTKAKTAKAATKVTKKKRTLLPFKHEGSPISAKAKELLDAGWKFLSNRNKTATAAHRAHTVRWIDPNGAPVCHTHRAYEKMKKMTMVTTKVKKKKPFSVGGKMLLNAGWKCQFFKKNQRWTYGTTVVWGTGKALAAYEEMMAK